MRRRKSKPKEDCSSTSDICLVDDNFDVKFSVVSPWGLPELLSNSLLKTTAVFPEFYENNQNFTSRLFSEGDCTFIIDEWIKKTFFNVNVHHSTSMSSIVVDNIKNKIFEQLDNYYKNTKSLYLWFKVTLPRGKHEAVQLYYNSKKLHFYNLQVDAQVLERVFTHGATRQTRSHYILLKLDFPELSIF